MPEVYDERGEPIGTMPVEEAYQDQPMAMPQQIPQQSSGAEPFLSPSFRGRTDVMPDSRGGMVVPQSGPTVALTNESQAETDRYLSDMAKAGQLDKAQKNVDQAMRFLGMRGVEKDVENGTPYAQALAKHLPFISWNNPQQAAIYSGIIERAQPPRPLSMETLDGVRVLRTPRGDRIVPQSAIPQPPVTSAQSIPFTNPETGEPVTGHFAVPSASGRGFTVHRKAGEVPEMTHSQRRLELNDLIKDKNAEIEAVPWVNPKDKVAAAARQQQLGTLNAELKKLQAQRPSATKKESEAAVPPKDKRTIGQVYQTPKGPHRWAKDGWEPAS